MSLYGLLPANVGMAAQFSENTFFTDKGFSSYNGMLVDPAQEHEPWSAV